MSDGEKDAAFVGECGDGGDDRPGEELWTSRGRGTSVAVDMIFYRLHHHTEKTQEPVLKYGQTVILWEAVR